MPVILANKVMDEICEAIGVDPRRTQKVIVDLEAGSVPRVYVQLIGDDILLTVIPPVAQMAKVTFTKSDQSSPRPESAD